MFFKAINDICLPASSVGSLPTNTENLYIGSGTDAGKFRVLAENGYRYVTEQIIPDLVVDNLTLTPSALTINNYPVWQHNQTCIYTDGSSWFYFHECPYPGYIPTTDDEYYVGSMPGNFYTQHGNTITFSAAGSASGSVEVQIDFGSAPQEVSGELTKTGTTQIFLAEVATWH